MATVVTVAVNVEVDEKEFNQLLGIYISLQKQAASIIVKKTARLFCKDMVQYTPPFSGDGPSSAKGAGMDSIAQKKGQANVSRDVRKIFAPLAQASASSVAEYGNLGIFSAWMRAKQELPPPHQPSWVFDWFKGGAFIGQGEWETFKSIEGKIPSKGVATFWSGTSESKVKSLHELVRGKPMYKVKNNADRVYVDDWKVVERYIKRVQTRVGRLKSGWYYAGKELGKMPSVGWVEKQGGQDKICIPKLTGSKPMITVGSHGRERYRRWWPLMMAARNHRAYVMRSEILRWLKDPKNHGTLRKVIAQMPQGFNVLETKE
jgi:hypothetical protein